MEVSSESGFWEFHQKGVTDRTCAPSGNVEVRENGKGRGCTSRMKVV